MKWYFISTLVFFLRLPSSLSFSPAQSFSAFLRPYISRSLQWCALFFLFVCSFVSLLNSIFSLYACCRFFSLVVSLFLCYSWESFTILSVGNVDFLDHDLLFSFYWQLCWFIFASSPYIFFIHFFPSIFFYAVTICWSIWLMFFFLYFRLLDSSQFHLNWTFGKRLLVFSHIIFHIWFHFFE